MTLVELLEDGTRFDAEYGDSLSNHLPMALAALHRLGASDARLSAYAARYAARLHAAPAIEPWPAGDAWAERLGDPRAWPLYRDLFREWLANEGLGPVLQQTLPALMPGCGASAFHGLIRVAHAAQVAPKEEVADALAYWACRWMDLGAAPRLPHGAAATGVATVRTAATQRDPDLVVQALTALPRSSAGLIAHRMQAAAVLPAFDGLVARLVIDDRTLARLARLAAQLYARSGNFTVLHLVTSALAVRVLLPALDDAESAHAAVADYWRAYAAGVVAAGVAPGRAPAPRPWEELVAAALASDGDHLVKLVDACREEQRHHGGAPDWQRAATRAVLG